MSTIDEVLAAAEVVDAVCVIDGETRIISVPTEYKELGVESDKKVTRVKFQCPKIVGDNIDLTEYNLYINYRNAGNKLNSYLVEDVTVTGDTINFSWLLSRHVTESPGTISYIVCAKKSDNTGVINEWNTKVATGIVGIGLEATEEIEEQNVDVIEQILRLIIELENNIGSGGSETTHGIVWNLTNVTSSNNAVSVADGSSLVAVLTPAGGYTLGDVTITMGGEVVTGAWNADTATVTIQSVTGDVVISCAGVEQTGPVDTSPNIVEYDKALDSSGGVYTFAVTGGCYTDFYTIPEGATNVTLYMADSESVAFSVSGKLQFWNDTKQVEYWSAASHRNRENSYVIADGATRFRTSLATNGIEDSYAYDSATGYIYFAGANTKYYGMTNIDGSTGGESAVSVAKEVDNQVAMLSLPTGKTVNPPAYSGLSADYVSMVQSNYDAMMAECLGDYNKIPIIVHTDQHGRIGASNQVMKLIGDMVNWYEVSKCMNLGDTVADRFGTTALENYLSATKDSIPLSKRLDVYGNHDVWDSDESQKYTVNQKRLSPYFKNIYARRHGNNGYFTVVDDYYNVKYLVISDLEYPDTNYSTRRITTAQAKFIVSELSEDDGRDIVLVSHVPLDSDEVTSRDSTYQAYSEKFLSDTMAHNSFMAMIAARKNKTRGTFTDSEGISHTYDFSNVSGDLLMSLHGHTHFEAYRTFENSITEFAFDWFHGNTFYFAYIDRKEKKFKVWKNEANVGALEISIA